MSEYIVFDKDHHEHHHKETFITKYIFSQDHKMIAKQYLFTGVIFMGIIAVDTELLFLEKRSKELFWNGSLIYLR